LLLIIFVLLWLLFGVINPEILSLASFYSLIRSALVPLLLALPEMLVIALGGIDMVFTIAASASSYCALSFWQAHGNPGLPFGMIVGVAMLTGIAMYLMCWFFIDRVKISAFITTLGANSLFKGAVLAFVGTSNINSLPAAMKTLGSMNIASASTSGGAESLLHISSLFIFVLYVAMYFVMEHSMFGRQIYAIGANEDFARRAGINVSKIRFFAFILAGVICAWAGILHDALSRFSMPLPTDIYGKELNSIAAVIIGIGGSRKAAGIVPGTALGVLLLQMISTNLVMLGVPAYWQQFVSGTIILSGLCFQTIRID
jgi:simple sugar transport system permease protein